MNYIDNMNHYLECLYDAGDPYALTYTLEELRDHKDPCIRMLVMMNRRSPLHVLEKLCWDIDPEVREGIQYQNKGPLEELKSAEENLHFILGQ